MAPPPSLLLEIPSESQGPSSHLQVPQSAAENAPQPGSRGLGIQLWCGPAVGRLHMNYASSFRGLWYPSYAILGQPCAVFRNNALHLRKARILLVSEFWKNKGTVDAHFWIRSWLGVVSVSLWKHLCQWALLLFYCSPTMCPDTKLRLEKQTYKQTSKQIKYRPLDSTEETDTQIKNYISLDKCYLHGKQGGLRKPREGFLVVHW